MRLDPPAPALAAIAAIAALQLAAASPARAQEGGFYSRAARPPGTFMVELSVPLKTPCKDSPMIMSFAVPQGLDGGGPADRAVSAAANRIMDMALAENQNLLKDEEKCWPGLGAAY